MSVLQVSAIQELEQFRESRDLMGIVQRHAPEGADLFFQKLMLEPIQLTAEIRKDSISEDVSDALASTFTVEEVEDPFFETWMADIVTVLKTYFNLHSIEAAALHIGSQRGCRRYHVDKVPNRMIVTYAGQGTEWLPNEAVDRQAYDRGERNENIVLDMKARKFLNPWDIAVFRGGSQGILHRTPDEALASSSIFMRLDPFSFWKDAV